MKATYIVPQTRVVYLSSLDGILQPGSLQINDTEVNSGLARSQEGSWDDYDNESEDSGTNAYW